MQETRIEHSVSNSRFIAVIGPAFSVEEARAFLARLRAEFPDASHHVPAYVIGHGASTITHCSDDSEPSGTAGRPALAVLSGSGLGDVIVVVIRYFGGTKLGTGGLVRAYSESVRLALAAVPRGLKAPVDTVMLAAPYNWFERLRLLVDAHGGSLIDQDFGADVTLTARFPAWQLAGFEDALREASHGTLIVELINTSIEIIPIADRG